MYLRICICILVFVYFVFVYCDCVPQHFYLYIVYLSICICIFWLCTSACPFAFSASSPSAAGLSTLLATWTYQLRYSLAKYKIHIQQKLKIQIQSCKIQNKNTVEIENTCSDNLSFSSASLMFSPSTWIKFRNQPNFAFLENHLCQLLLDNREIGSWGAFRVAQLDVQPVDTDYNICLQLKIFKLMAIDIRMINVGWLTEWSEMMPK